MAKKKITQLPVENNPQNSVTIVSKGGQSKQLSINALRDWIMQEINSGLENTIVPNIEISIRKNTLMYKINNISSEILEQIGSEIKIGIVRYKQYNRKIGETILHSIYSKGRKWTLVDDTTSEYVQKNIGDNVFDLKEKIFWTDVKIVPEQLNTDSYFSFQPFGLTAENITSRYMYFVTDNKNINMRLSSLNYASTRSMQEAQSMFRVTGKNSKIDFENIGRIFYSLNIGLVAFRDVKIGGVTKRIFGNIVPFRVCLSWVVTSHNPLHVVYYSNFKKFKQ